MYFSKIDITFLLKAGITLLAILGLISCREKSEQVTLFSIDSLVSAQVNLLTASKAKLYKEAELSGRIDTVTYLPADSTAWSNELDVFRELKAINKPVNLRSYRVNDGLTDITSNLIVKEIYTTEKLPVSWLRIYYQGSIEKLRKIEASFNDQNSLYKSERLVSMHFRQVKNKTMLTSYSIVGGQKMIMDDSVSFSIRGSVVVD